VVIFDIAAVVPELTHARGDAVRVCDDSAGISVSAEVLARIKARARRDAPRTGAALIARCALRLCGIFEHDQVVRARDLVDRLHRRQLAE
jgi:hypothetical protein